MKKKLLTHEETRKFMGMYSRLHEEMQKKGMGSDKELLDHIRTIREDAPDRTIITRLKSSANDYRAISCDTLYVLADGVGVSMDYLLTGKDNTGEKHKETDGLSSCAARIMENWTTPDTDKKNDIMSPYHKSNNQKKMHMINALIEGDTELLTAMYDYIYLRPKKKSSTVSMCDVTAQDEIESKISEERLQEAYILDCLHDFRQSFDSMYNFQKRERMGLRKETH